MGKMKQHAHTTLINNNNKNFRRRNRRAVGWQRVEVTIEEEGDDDVVIVVERCHNRSSPVFILDRPEHPMWKIFAKKKAWLGTTMLVQCVLLLVLGAYLGHRTLSWYMRHRLWVPAPIMFLERTCPAVSYETIMTTSTTMPTICITTLTDNPTTAKKSSTIQKLLRWRNFDNVLDLTWKNKAAYAAKYGYHLVDSSFLLDTTRPPAWSKIRAVQHLLLVSSMKTSGDASDNNSSSSSSSLLHCDWVLWMDADTVIMNSKIRITDFLPTPSAHNNNNTDSPIDWVIASDKGGGYNSGVFLVRNVPWSYRLLEEWWNMKEYVRPPGLALSGDNAALKALLAQKMNDPLEAVHFAVPPRCTINSFAKFVSWRESEQLRLGGHSVLKTKDWYMDTEHYHKGDFIAHTPGIDNKAECLKLLLQEAQ